ncbi:MAG: hypothetical protein GF350_15165 [Chitinivibrionales bacterium]|nr:hypothetical protein [Chitinivibrionales bacterium]
MKSWVCCVAPVFAACLFFCSKSPTDSEDSGTGTLQLSFRIKNYNSPGYNSLAKSGRIAETTWDSLKIAIEANDISPVVYSLEVDMYDGVVYQTLENVKAGENRTISAWTVDSDGDTIHGAAELTVSFAPNDVVPVQFVLVPICGSIYIALKEFPSEVDSVCAAFTSESGETWETRDDKTSKLFMSLDKIPYGATGTMLIAGLDASGDTLASWKQDGFEFTGQNLTVEASFVDVADISLDVSLGTPGVTLIQGMMSTTDSLDDEQTSAESLLIISELMFTAGSGTANSLDYIEIFNPTQSDINLDTLIVDITGSDEIVTNVTISAESFYVVGNSAIPLSDSLETPSGDSIVNPWNADTTVSMDLVSTTNWITLMRTEGQDTIIIDRVAYENSSNILGWPDLGSSAKTSVVLDSLPADAEYNNYGKNWNEAVSSFQFESETYCGTPGGPGR